MRKFKNALLILIIIISQLHVLFRGISHKVDWFLFTDKQRGLNFSIFMVGVFIRFIIVHYCLFKPNNINRKIAFYLLVLSVLDLIHFFLTSGLGYAELKLFISYVIYRFLVKHV